VLRSDGTCFINMGDSYQDKQLLGMPWRLALALQQPTLKCNGCENVAHKSAWGHFPNGRLICPACELSKGWTVEEQGWWLRSDIIWNKKNPMPESVTDRPTKAHEYVFLLSKSARYFYDNDAVREDSIYPNDNRKSRSANGQKRLPTEKIAGVRPGSATYPTRNRRSVWTIATQPFSAAHFATFPTALVEPMIKAGTSEKGCCPECGAPWERVTEKPDMSKRPIRSDTSKMNTDKVHLNNNWNDYPKSAGQAYQNWRNANPDTTTGWQPTCDCSYDALHKGKQVRIEYAPVPCIVVDTFAGTCTVGMVADRLGRDSIMIELNPEYAAMGEQRINDDAGWLADVEVEETALRQLELL